MKRIMLKEGSDLSTGPNPPIGYKYIGLNGTDISERTGATTTPIGVVDYDNGVEKLTGELLDGKAVYMKTFTGSTFPVAASYASIPHGLDMSTVKILESFGYVDYAATSSAAMYANYLDSTKFYWYWTDAANKPYRLVLKYTKD